MAPRFANRYRLRSTSSASDGRPCWVQKVRKAKDLFVFLQACRPDEEGFPYVQALLVSVSPDGKIREYGTEEILAKTKRWKLDDGRNTDAIEWVDGTDVFWIAEEPQE